MERSAVHAQERSAETIEMKEANYDQLCAAVQAQRGKVVIVDIWAYY